ncbi:alpha/beta hydrolase fold domain-containing protein [Conyzicola lurida]|nr:alpha/beta hydrolase fold domain-containing protein [Conyzicola lurida]
MSLAMAVTRLLLRLQPTSTRSAASVERVARDHPPAAPVPPALLRVAHMTTRSIGGRDVITLTPKQGTTGTQLLYTHGGCYVFPLLPVHWRIIATLMRESGATVTVPLYGLAPEHHVDEAYALLEGVYRGLAATGSPVFLAGDSAGGGLALGQALRYRDVGLPAPAGVVLISPWVDVTMANPDIRAVEPRDPMLGVAGFVAAGAWWANGADPRSPLVSPLYGRLDGLPPVSVHQGGRDILAPDALSLVSRLREAGNDVSLEYLPGAFHDYVGAPWTPEARATLRSIGRVLRA